MKTLKTRINNQAVERMSPSGMLGTYCSHCGLYLRTDGTVKDLRAFVAAHCNRRLLTIYDSGVIGDDFEESDDPDTNADWF